MSRNAEERKKEGRKERKKEEGRKERKKERDNTERTKRLQRKKERSLAESAKERKKEKTKWLQERKKERKKETKEGYEKEWKGLSRKNEEDTNRKKERKKERVSTLFFRYFLPTSLIICFKTEALKNFPFYSVPFHRFFFSSLFNICGSYTLKLHIVSAILVWLDWCKWLSTLYFVI